VLELVSWAKTRAKGGNTKGKIRIERAILGILVSLGYLSY